MRFPAVRHLALALVVLVWIGSCTAAPRAHHQAARRAPTATSTTKHGTPSREDGHSTAGRLTPKGATSRGWSVTRVVDGDTMVVTRGGRELTVRLIGIDTPETVAPGEPVMCFGPQATRFAQGRLEGSDVVLELDRSQGRLDRYGRTLVYLWVDHRSRLAMFNERAVRAGFAREYTYDSAYAWQSAFRRAEAVARAARRGLWAKSTCNGDIEQPDQQLG